MKKIIVHLFFFLFSLLSLNSENDSLSNICGDSNSLKINIFSVNNGKGLQTSRNILKDALIEMGHQDSPRVQVLQQVISDLNTATNLLSNNYVDASDATTTDRVRPTKAAATALLARAYLYAGDYNKSSTDYQNAVTAASNVISNNTYSLCSNLSGVNSVFLKNSSEAIWQLATPLPSSYDTPDGALFVLLAAPTSSQYLISAQLLSTFEVGDQRKVNWIGSVTINGTTYNFPYKYKDKTYLGNEYMIAIRT